MLSYYPSILREDLKKITKYLIEGNICQGSTYYGYALVTPLGCVAMTPQSDKNTKRTEKRLTVCRQQDKAINKHRQNKGSQLIIFGQQKH